jgi:hypothetical protein
VRGSVYAYTTKRGQRRWRAVFDALPDPLTGERRQTTKRGFATKASAEAFLRQSLEKVVAGTYTQPSRITLAEYLAEWLDGLRKKPTTMAWPTTANPHVSTSARASAACRCSR